MPTRHATCRRVNRRRPLFARLSRERADPEGVDVWAMRLGSLRGRIIRAHGLHNLFPQGAGLGSRQAAQGAVQAGLDFG